MGIFHSMGKELFVFNNALVRKGANQTILCEVHKLNNLKTYSPLFNPVIEASGN